MTHRPLPKYAGLESVANLHNVRFASGDNSTADLRLRMQKIMQEKAAVFRTGETLEQGVKEIDECNADLRNLKTEDRGLIWNTDLIESLELQNLMSQAVRGCWRWCDVCVTCDGFLCRCSRCTAPPTERKAVVHTRVMISQ